MNTIFFFVKFFKKPEHAEDFLNGRVFTNRLSRFKYAEDGDASGRIDPHEGTISWMQPGQCTITLNATEMSVDGAVPVQVEDIDISDDLAGPASIQMNWFNHLNIFCVHAVHTGDLILENTTEASIEALRKKLMIPVECLALGEYAVVVMNVREFLKRLYCFAQKQGYRYERRLVKYYDPETFHGNFNGVEALFWKQNQYSFQREFRFVFDSGTLDDSPKFMEIGDIRNIAKKFRSVDLNGAELIGGKIEVDLRHEPSASAKYV